MSKRSAEISVTSGDDKRQRLSDDDSEFLESEESEAFIEQFDGDVSKIDSRTGTIYLITNLKTGKVYVGLTTQKPEVRWRAHKNSSKNPKVHFHRSIRKHGWGNFKPEILAENVPIEELCDLEMYYIAFYDSYNNGYNSTKGGGGLFGYIYTEEQKRAQSLRLTKNHNVNGGGCISFDKTSKKWKVRTRGREERKHIGYYLTREKAIEALNMYNEKGERMPSDVTNRKAGTGCVYFNKSDKKWMAVIQGKVGKFIGLYLTKEKAIEALKLYNERGERMPSDKLKAGRGSIQERFSETMGKRFRGELKINGKRYRTKTRASREAVEKDFMELRLAFLK